MEIPNVPYLKADAAHALRRARDPQRVILAYAGIHALIAAVLTVLNYWLSNRIADTGGLGNLGLRSILSTAQTILPIAQTVVLMCLDFGYLHAMMRISRGQYADHTDLKMGFQKFGPVLRLNLLQGFLCFGLAMVVFYLSLQIFLLTPWSDPLYELLLPVAESMAAATSTADAAALLGESAMAQAQAALVPMLVIYVVVYCALLIPISYRFRMASYLLLDDPRGRAMAALRDSNRLMRRNGMKLFRLDLSFWWYYALTLLASLVSYGDVWLPMLGIELPLNATVSYFLFFGLYLAMVFAIHYFLRNALEVTYVKAYDAICPKPQDNGAVLGNIFDM